MYLCIRRVNPMLAVLTKDASIVKPWGYHALLAMN